MLRTRLTEAYGLEVPFIGAGMGFVATPPLVAAVSNAGGMGTLGAALVPPDQLRDLLRQTRSPLRETLRRELRHGVHRGGAPGGLL